MPPLPENLTDRYWLKVSGPMGDHETVFRFAPSVLPQDAVARIIAIANAVAPNLVNTASYVALRHQESGSSLSWPLAWTPIVGTSTAEFLPEEYPQFVSATGRSADGRRSRITFFGWPFQMTPDYRGDIGELSIVAPLVNALKTSDPPLVSASGLPVIWNNYVNLGRNAHFQRKQRRTL